ncbi:MAG: hypothetical protein ACRCVI_03260 [Mycoplasmoidaceae bacterium]
MAVYNQTGHQNVGVKVYNKKQVNMLTNALLIAGLGFIATCLIGFLFTWLFSFNPISATTIYVISGPLLFVSFVLSFVWGFRIRKASNFFMFTIISLYCISMGISLGLLFLLAELPQIMLAFGIVGFIFLGTFGISKIMSTKTAMNLGKILLVATIFYIIAIVLTTISSFFLYGNGIYFIIAIAISALGGLLSIGYLAYTLWMIQKMDEFLIDDEEMKWKLSVYFGFFLLTNLISLLYRILYWILLFTRH